MKILHQIYGSNVPARRINKGAATCIIINMWPLIFLLLLFFLAIFLSPFILHCMWWCMEKSGLVHICFCRIFFSPCGLQNPNEVNLLSVHACSCCHGCMPKLLFSLFGFSQFFKVAMPGACSVQ